MKMRILRLFGWLSMSLALPWMLLACEPSDEKGEATPRVAMTVYKSPSCGCCEKWVEHMEQAGFKAKIEHPKDLDAVKKQFGMGPDVKACHTALIGGYVFEGHIPADDIKRFLQEKPAHAKGLAVPKMPQGSPGMEMGVKREPYQVLLIQQDGRQQVYAQH